MGKVITVLQFLAAVLWAMIAKEHERKGDEKFLIVTAYINCALSFICGVLRLITPEEAYEIETKED